MDWGKVVLDQQPHGTVLTAEHHEEVRGRSGRTWQVMPDQLLLTYLIKPNHLNITTPDTHGTAPLTYLYFALSAALCKAIGHYVPESRIKWPNDCMLGNKKVAGMLLEPVWHGSDLRGIIFGVGINVNSRFPRGSEMDAIATSMRTFQTKGAFDTTEVFRTLNKTLTIWFATWQKGEYEKIWHYWLSHHLPEGTPINAHHADGTTITGALVSPHRDGSITITIDGNQHIITIGDVDALLVNSK